jgi:hypothetical protein
MIRFKINDRYIKGTVAFERFDDKAIMSYVGTSKLPTNAQYTIEGEKWQVVQVRTSNYNPNVINVDMVLSDKEPS